MSITKKQFILTASLVFLTLFCAATLFVLKPKVTDSSIITTAQTLKAQQIVAGKPVQWVAIVNKNTLDNNQNLVKLPKEATNIKAEKVTEQETQQIFARAERADSMHSETAQEAKFLLANQEQGIKTLFTAGLLTGVKNLLASIVDSVGDFINPSIVWSSDGKLYNVKNKIKNSQFVEITYETPAPQIIETQSVNKKEVTIKTDKEYGYTNVLAYTSIPEVYSIVEERKLNIKWNNNESEKVAFKAYDLNSNGKLDYVEWVVPHLSSQTYSIIYITRAVKLDAEKNPTEDVYDKVYKQDSIWTTINQNEYLRVTFERQLTNNKDITIYARPSFTEGSAGQATVQVYTADTNQLVATFPIIDHEGVYKILLTNLSTSTDIFDLKVVSGSVDFDYIVDPVVWLTGWSYRKKITISNDNVGADLSNFPLHVKINADSNMVAALATGYDVRFTDSGGETLLKYERETWSGGGGSSVTAEFWVKVPTIATAADTEIYMYWGKADATDGQDAANVWDSNFKAVWHLADGSTLSALDSTSNNNDGTNNNSVAATTGLVDGAGLFNGSNTNLYMAPAASLDFSTAQTVTAWVYMTGTDATYQNIFAQRNNCAGTFWQFYARVGADCANNAPNYGTSSGGSVCDTSALPTNTWTMLTGVYNGSQVLIYRNGSQTNSSNYSSGWSAGAGSQTYIGWDSCTNPNNGHMQGKIDEARISSSARSAEWIKFEYCNMTPAATGTCIGDYEITFGTQETNKILKIQGGLKVKGGLKAK